MSGVSGFKSPYQENKRVVSQAVTEMIDHQSSSVSYSAPLSNTTLSINNLQVDVQYFYVYFLSPPYSSYSNLLGEQLAPKPYRAHRSLMSDPEQMSLLMDSSARTGSMSCSMSK